MFIFLERGIPGWGNQSFLGLEPFLEWCIVGSEPSWRPFMKSRRTPYLTMIKDTMIRGLEKW